MNGESSGTIAFRSSPTLPASGKQGGAAWRDARTARKQLGPSLIAAVLLLALPAGVQATALLAPSAGVPDGNMGGATVARPITPSFAAFSNPAGLAGIPDGYMSVSVGLMYGESAIDGAPYSTYDEEENHLGFAPEFGVVLGENDRWHYGFATYGSVGTAFNFPADPEAGVAGSFLSELTVITLAPMVAYELTDNLNVGMAITPLLGQIRVRFPLPGGEGGAAVRSPQSAKYKTTGPGLQGMVGMQWRASERLYVGAGFRTPGEVWTDGSIVLPGGGRHDLNLDIEMPMQAFVGITADVTDKFEVGLAGRWTDASSFGSSLVKTKDNAAAPAPLNADRALVHDANDEWRISAGAAYDWSERLTLRGGVGYADSIVGDHGVSPMVFDAEDVKLSLGFSLDLGKWTLDVSYGRQFKDEQHISPDEAMIMPGSYEIGGDVLFIGMRGVR